MIRVVHTLHCSLLVYGTLYTRGLCVYVLPLVIYTTWKGVIRYIHVIVLTFTG